MRLPHSSLVLSLVVHYEARSRDYVKDCLLYLGSGAGLWQACLRILCLRPHQTVVRYLQKNRGHFLSGVVRCPILDRHGGCPT